MVSIFLLHQHSQCCTFPFVVGRSCLLSCRLRWSSYGDSKNIFSIMILSLAFYDISFWSWLVYALSSFVTDPLNAILYTLIPAVVLFLVLGRWWGLAWNKAWIKDGETKIGRWILIGIVSFVVGISLAAVNALHGGNIFGTEVKDAMVSILEAGSVKYDELKDRDLGYAPAKRILDGVQENIVETEEEQAKIDNGDSIISELTDKIVLSYFEVLKFLWIIIVTGGIGIFIGVGLASYKGIKLKQAFKINDK